MEQIALPTKECRGVDIPDAMGNPTGQVYRARRPGYVEVDNPNHARLLRHSLGGDSLVCVGFNDNLPAASCGCGRDNWPWQTTCGKCGDELVSTAA